MPEPENLTVLGLMSGTSLDGVDLALCQFKVEDQVAIYEPIKTRTISYPYYLREKLEDAIQIDPGDLHQLDQELGSYYAGLIREFLSDCKVKPDLISSHGHTILHQPDKGITMQIGDGKVMATKTGITVINDFRSQDVSKGGQGAPLVPVGDRDLFGAYDMCLNLGGIANLSFEQSGQRIACDISPCNMALNTVASWINIDFDDKGQLASEGKLNNDLLDRLNALEYYHAPPPKSLGKEWFVRSFLPEIRKTEISIRDLLHTINVHISDQVANFINGQPGNGIRTLVTGGGAYNQSLMKLIQNKCNSELFIPDEQLIDFKEAIIFAYLGFLKYQERVNVLASCTGAASDTSAGMINQPN